MKRTLAIVLTANIKVPDTKVGNEKVKFAE